MLSLLSITILSHPQNKINTNNFILTGTVTGNIHKVILIYPDIPGHRHSYTIHVKNGHFVFKGYISSPVYAGIMNDDKVDPKNTADVSNYSELFLSPGNMTVTLRRGEFDQAKITGSPTQDEWNDLRKNEEPINKAKDSLYKIMFAIERAGNTPKNHRAHVAVAAKLDQLGLRSDSEDYYYIRSHPQSYLSAYLLQNFAGSEMRLDSVEKPYNAFTEPVKESPSGKAIARIIIRRKAGAVGTTLRMPSGINVDGSRFNSGTIKIENYLLIYFFTIDANNNTQVKTICHRYHPHGLNIIGVSLDYPFKRMWRDTVKKQKLTLWHNIYADPVANLDDFYNISEMGPTLFLLVDKGHKIIGRYRSDSRLYKRDYDEGGVADLTKKLVELYR